MNFSSNHSAVICLDLGTSTFKAAAFDASCTLITYHTREFELYQDGRFCESDFFMCERAAFSVLKTTIRETQEKGYIPEAFVISSQAQTFVPVDGNFDPIRRGIVWIDARAEDEAEELNANLDEFPRTAGFKEVLPLLYLAKLLWVKRREPALFSSAAYFPLIHEFVAARLTDSFYTDYTNFGMGGLLNLSHGSLNQKALQLLGLQQQQFPSLDRPLNISAPCTPEVAETLGLKKTVPVYHAGNDQSASAVGAGISGTGDINMNFGTALVCYTLLNFLPEELETDQIAGIAPVEGCCFLLSLENQFGNIIEKIKQRFFPDASYDEFFSCCVTCRERDIFTPITFSEDDVQYDATEAPEIVVGSVIEHYLNRVVAEHEKNIKKFVRPQQICISGGATQSSVFVQLLREKLNTSIATQHATRESGLLGDAKLFYRKKQAGSENH